MRFTLRQLTYFIAAAETGSVTRAAEQVNISQPSISAAILHLEVEFGAQLFVRHHAQGLSLTPAGQRLLVAAKEALRTTQGLYDVVNSAMGVVAGPINLGNPAEFTVLELADMIVSMTGSKSRIVHLPAAIDDPQQRRPDITRAGEQLGWRPHVDVRDGLLATIAYFDAALRHQAVGD